MSSEKINQAIQLIRSGNTKAAGKILSEIVKQDPRNETAWLWLAGCFDSADKKKFCLKKALDINPDNQKAWAALDRLSQDEMNWQSRLDVALENDTSLGLDPGLNMNESVYGQNPFASNGLASNGGTPIEQSTSYADSVPRGAELFETRTETAEPEADEGQFENTRSFTGIFIFGFITILGAIAIAVYILISRGILFPPSAEKVYAKEMRGLMGEIEDWQVDLANFETVMAGPYSGVLSASGGGTMTAENALFAYLALLAEPNDAINPSTARSELDALVGPSSSTAYQSGAALLAALDATAPPAEILTAHQSLYTCIQQETRIVESVNQIATSGVRTGFAYSTEACDNLAENLATLRSFAWDH